MIELLKHLFKNDTDQFLFGIFDRLPVTKLELKPYLLQLKLCFLFTH